MPFVLYTRRGCHLCEAAEDMVAALLPAGAHAVIDVDSDAALVRRFGQRVPVLAWGDSVVMEGRFDEALLGRLLAAGGPATGLTSPA